MHFSFFGSGGCAGPIGRTIFLKSISANKLFKRYLINIFCVVSLTIALIVVIVFSLYSNMQISASKAYSIGQLEQVCEMTNLLYEQMRSVSNQILQSAATNSCLSTTSFDRLKETSAVIKLREMQTANPYVRYVSFYNSASNRFVSSSTADFLTDADIEYYYDLLSDTYSDTCTLRLIGANYATQQLKTKYVYSFIFELRVRNSGDADLAIIDVDEGYLSQAIGNLRTTNGFQQVLLLDRDGNVFSSNTVYDDAQEFTQSTYISLDLEQIPELTGASGSFSQTLGDGTSALVTYARSDISGFTILNIVPYSNIFSGLPQIAVLTALAGLIVLAVGIVISYRTSARLSAPIEVLYRNYVKKPSTDRRAGNELDQLSQAFSEMYAKADKLEQGLIASYSDSKKRILQRLLHGESTQVPNYLEVYQKFGINLLAPYYCIIMVNCVSRENTLGPDDSNYFICSYALENIVSEVAGHFGSISTYRNSKNMLAVLLPLRRNEYPKRMDAELHRIVDVMAKEFDMETTICIGNIVETAANINMCYEATTIALASSAIRNRGKVFFADEVTQTMNLNQYHNKLHIKLAEHIRNEDLDACSQEFDLALSYMTNVSFVTAITYFNHVMMTLLDSFSATFSDDEDYRQLIDKLNEINQSLPNVYMLRRKCMEFISLLIRHLSLSKKYGNEQAAETARQYIDQNYANPDLSLRMLADMVGLSPAYFGKIFTAYTTYSFNDYLTNTRMKKAASLLIETKLPISQISESIGILNTNYFYSVFKKKFGMTPLAYRRSKSNLQADKPDSSEEQ